MERPDPKIPENLTMGPSAMKDASRHRPCVWMQAGVVYRKVCKIDYNCPACRFDKTLQKIAAENGRARRAGRAPQGKRGDIVFWMDKMRELPMRRRPCVHHMKQRIDFRACTHDYRCSNCEFDQYFNDQYTVYTMVRPVDVLDVDGVKAPQGYYLHPGHAWAKIETGAFVRVGVDDFALRMLGPLDRIEGPLMGKQVHQGRPGIVLHRGGKAARVLSPVSGVVTAVNTRLQERGGLGQPGPVHGRLGVAGACKAASRGIEKPDDPGGNPIVSVRGDRPSLRDH